MHTTGGVLAQSPGTRNRLNIRYKAGAASRRFSDWQFPSFF